MELTRKERENYFTERDFYAAPGMAGNKKALPINQKSFQYFTYYTFKALI
jgi:hypothetical protein